LFLFANARTLSFRPLKRQTPIGVAAALVSSAATRRLASSGRERSRELAEQAPHRPEGRDLEKEDRKRVKRQKDDLLPLDPWQRYRALSDALDENYDLIDIANREARFALIMMGALNAALFVIGTRSSLVAALPSGARAGLALGLVLYGALAVHFLLQAIEALRPRKFHPRLPDATPATADRYPLGVRYFEDVVERDAEAHWKAWNEVRLGQINAELAVQGHSLSLKNKAKYVAVRRLYAGLRLMTVLAALMLMVMAGFALMA
jgi:hypothetical protein